MPAEYGVQKHTTKVSGQNIYAGRCRICDHLTYWYMSADKAETDVQEHLWERHLKAVFRARRATTASGT